MKSIISHFWPALSRNVNTTFTTRSELVFARRTEQSQLTSRANPVVVTIELSTVQAPDFSGKGTTTHTTTTDGKDEHGHRIQTVETFESSENTLRDSKTDPEGRDLELGLTFSESRPNDGDSLPRSQTSFSVGTGRCSSPSPRGSLAEASGDDGARQHSGVTEEGRVGRNLDGIRERIDRRSWEVNLQMMSTMREEQEDAFSRQI